MAASVSSATQYRALADARGTDLLLGLRAAVADGHISRSYKEASHELFARVDDTDDDDRVTDLYTGRLITGIDGRAAATASQLNVEHTWPRSSGANGAAEADLHHLMTAGEKPNRIRGNFPFGHVVDETWRSRRDAPTYSVLGRDASGAVVFEPPAGVRGDIARGLLYFATRYGADRQIGVETANFEHELPTLLQWHAADPVDDSERARNDAIAAFQGNRNPYVDRPEFVDQVGVEAFSNFTD